MQTSFINLLCLYNTVFIFGVASGRHFGNVKFVNIAKSLFAEKSNRRASANAVNSDTILEDSKSILSVKEPNAIIRSSDIPAEFNAASAWPGCLRVKHPRDQGACRSDWAVAAASVLTDRLCIYFWSRYNEPMSAYHVLSCCADCGDGCKSGSAAMAWKFFEKEGVVTGGDRHSQMGCLPYQVDPCDHRPTSPKYCSIFKPIDTPSCPRTCIDSRYDFQTDRIFVNRSYAIANDVEEIQKEILQNGPVQASILVYSDLLYYNQNESQGVYYHYAGPLLGGMSVKIIGWGTDLGSNLNYWLVVNSWGNEWGQKGTFRIKRGTNECGVESNVIAGDPSMNHSYPSHVTQ